MLRADLLARRQHLCPVCYYARHSNILYISPETRMKLSLLSLLSLSLYLSFSFALLKYREYIYRTQNNKGEQNAGVGQVSVENESGESKGNTGRAGRVNERRVSRVIKVRRETYKINYERILRVENIA